MHCSGVISLMVAGLVCAAAVMADSVDSFTLINADTDADLRALTNGATINLAVDGSNLNVRANTTPATVGSVRFAYDGNANYRTENTPPYALAGDTSGGYNPWTPSLGAHTLGATPFSASGGGGTTGTPLTINFTVISSAGNQPPSVSITNPVSGALFPPSSDITIDAVASDGDGSITKVEFFADATKLGEDVTSPYNLVWSNVAAGSYLLTARAIDSATATNTSTAVSLTVGTPGSDGVVTGELKKWHCVTVTFDGPSTSETATPNPFRDYRLNVTFTHPVSGKSYSVPGFFAGDGNTAETSADSGDKWRVHFAPDETGTWNYLASFRTGPDVAISDSPTAGSATHFDGASGSVVIGPTDKTGRDHRGKGRLQYVGEHHLRFAETGEYFVKAGADAPENLLAYADFDDTPNTGNRRKTWSFHAGDYDPADAATFTWQSDKGANLLGAIKYLASKGMNAFSFLPFNVDGDDDNVFPQRLTGTVAAYEAVADNQRWTSGTLYHDRFDISKLDQWDRIFAYGDKLGMYLHFKTLETENELRMDGGNQGLERSLYYRELIARFGYHLALNWNLGEEINNATTAQKQAWSQYFYDHDPYHHHQVIHNGANHYDLLGSASKLTGFSLQTGPANVFAQTLNYLNLSAAAGRPWVVANDEQNPANVGILPDADEADHDSVRGPILWGNLLAGGAGIESYFGYSYAHSDLNCEDFRSRDNWWNQCRYALEFFTEYLPYHRMKNRNDLIGNAGNDITQGFCFAATGEVYAVYLPGGGTKPLDLGPGTNTFNIHWFNPRAGGALQTGTVAQITGLGSAGIGNPPSETTQDWVALVRRSSPLTFSIWQSQQFSAAELADPSVSGEEADPDGDGLINLFEYALGLEPKTTDSAGILTSDTKDDHLTLTYAKVKAATDLTYAVEATSDITGSWSSAGVTEQLLGDNGTVQTIKAIDPATISGNLRRFMRLLVTRP